MTRHAMIDLETLGVGPRAVIVQVGICFFDPWAPKHVADLEGHSWNVDPESCASLGGQYDGSTIMWWLAQSAVTREGIAPGASRWVMRSVLNVLTAVMQRGAAVEGVWAQGAAFDIPILEHYFSTAGLEVPWGYGRVRDTRTVYWAAESLGWQRDRSTTAHSALADCRAQVAQLQSALAVIGSSRQP